MSIGVGLLLSLISAAVFASVRINFSNHRTYPSEVTLQSSLPKPAKVQQYGECHILAALSAAEAACFRHTGRYFSLSSAYQFYHHLRTEIENPNSQPFLKDLNDGQFSQNDAGVFESTIERIQNNNVLLESDYTMSQFNQAIEPALKIRKQYWDLYSKKQSPNQSEYEKKMRTRLAIDLDLSVKQPTQRAQNSSNVCEFNQLKMLPFNVTPERAVALINNGIPFICQTKLGSTSGQHVVLYAGYKFSPGHPENLSFKVRDSRLSRLIDTGWAPYCIRAVVVFNPEERHTVLKSINL